jgi:hypothetical protein
VPPLIGPALRSALLAALAVVPTMSRAARAV